MQCCSAMNKTHAPQGSCSSSSAPLYSSLNRLCRPGSGAGSGSADRVMWLHTGCIQAQPHAPCAALQKPSLCFLPPSPWCSAAARRRAARALAPPAQRTAHPVAPWRVPPAPPRSRPAHSCPLPPAGAWPATAPPAGRGGRGAPQGGRACRPSHLPAPRPRRAAAAGGRWAGGRAGRPVGGEQEGAVGAGDMSRRHGGSCRPRAAAMPPAHSPHAASQRTSCSAVLPSASAYATSAPALTSCRHCCWSPTAAASRRRWGDGAAARLPPPPPLEPLLLRLRLRRFFLLFRSLLRLLLRSFPIAGSLADDSSACLADDLSACSGCGPRGSQCTKGSAQRQVWKRPIAVWRSLAAAPGLSGGGGGSTRSGHVASIV